MSADRGAARSDLVPDGEAEGAASRGWAAASQVSGRVSEDEAGWLGVSLVCSRRIKVCICLFIFAVVFSVLVWLGLLFRACCY